ncbi:MAG: tetratricopeptide repeat protein [Deltaproteobacteria bacterium]|nr:tetratricopeptide repeat protein [Deltaproteobacteria bacterium]
MEDSRVPPAGVTIKCPKCSHTFVAKRPPPPGSTDMGPIPRGSSAIGLPGSRGDVGGDAVGLPGAVAPGAGSGDDLDLDLGLEGALPGSGGFNAGFGAGAGAGLGATSNAHAQSGPGMGPGVLDFIDESAQAFGMPAAARGRASFRVRARNGGVAGPFSEDQLHDMLRGGELSGHEDISEDGVSWRAMTSHPELNRTINDARGSNDMMSFGEVDLGGGDQPSPGIHASVRPAAGNAFDPNAPLAGAGAGTGGLPPRPTEPSSLLQATLGGTAFGPADGAAPLDTQSLGPEGGKATKGRTQDLHVGAVPEGPPIWKTYRKPIIAFAIVVAFVLLGVFTHLTPHGAYGYKFVAELMKPPPPPPPPKPPAPPPKTVDLKEIQVLIDEGSYEAFRSVLATTSQAGDASPDNVLASAKARGLATLYYGSTVFPLPELEATVQRLGSLELDKAFGGNAAKAKVEALKAQAALALSKKAPAALAGELASAFEAQAYDKELGMLSGLVHLAAGDPTRAMTTLDKTLVIDPKYAPALFAMGQAVAQAGGDTAKADAAEWYRKAAEAEPAHARAGLAAAALYRELHHYGPERRVLALTASRADRGFPPDARAAFLYRVAKLLDEAGASAQAAPLAAEATRLDPANVEYVSMAAVTLAASGQGAKAIDMLSPVLKRNPSEVAALVARARAHMEAGDVAKAYVDLEAAQKLRPNAPELLLLEANFNERLAKYNDAARVLERAARISKSGDILTALGRIELHTGAIEPAYTSATAAVAADPFGVAAHVLLGQCLLQRNQRSQALASFKTAVDLDDENMGARLGYANTLRDMSPAERADAKVGSKSPIPIYLDLLGEHSDDPTIMFEYGRALEMEGDLSGALELYHEASRLNEKDARPHLKVVQALVERSDPDIEHAKESLAKAESIEVASGRQRADVRFWVARIAYLEKRYGDATSAIRSACEVEPTNAVYQYWMGKILEANNSLFEAIQAYERALAQNSRLSPALRALGWASLERHEFDTARTYFSRYREANPADATIFVDIGLSYTRQNRDEDAMGAFMKAIKEHPDDSQALLQIGNILARRGQENQATTYFAQAARAAPELGEAWCQWGIALSRKKLGKEGRAALQRCLKLENSPEDLKENARQILGEI